eukprot:928975-Pelagomonas_calceolata.AAC.2
MKWHAAWTRNKKKLACWPQQLGSNQMLTVGRPLDSVEPDGTRLKNNVKRADHKADDEDGDYASDSTALHQAARLTQHARCIQVHVGAM